MEEGFICLPGSGCPMGTRRPPWTRTPPALQVLAEHPPDVRSYCSPPGALVGRTLSALLPRPVGERRARRPEDRSAPRARQEAREPPLRSGQRRTPGSPRGAAGSGPAGHRSELGLL